MLLIPTPLLNTQTNNNAPKTDLTLNIGQQSQPAQEQPAKPSQPQNQAPEQPDPSRKAEDYNNTWQEKTSNNVKEMIEIGKVLNENELKMQDNNKVVS